MWHLSEHSGVSERTWRRFQTDETWTMETADALARGLGFEVDVRLLPLGGGDEMGDIFRMGDCPRCRRFVKLSAHKCPPIHRVWCEDRDELEVDARPVYASDAEEASTEWAKLDDSRGDYAIVRGSEAIVCVRSPDGEITRWVVHGESVPQYSAVAVSDR